MDYKPRPSKLCAGCKNIRYCSRAHQKLDWAVHKHVCKQFRKLEPRPSPEMVRVIYLPVDKTEPEFKYVLDGKKTSQNIPDCAIEFDLTQPFNTWIQCCARGCHDDFEEGIIHVKDCYGIYVFTHELSNITRRDTRTDRCINQFTAGEIAHWAGPVLAFGRHSVGSKCRDLDTTDFKVIFDKICRLERFKTSRTIQGVRVNCDGHMKKHNQPRFERETVRVDANTREPHRPEELPRLVFGQGLRIGQLLTEENVDARNPTVSLLDIACGDGEKPWGYYRRQKCGNCVVIREDGKPLTVQDLKTFCDWIDKDLRKRFNAARKISTQARKMIDTEPSYPKIEKAQNDVLDNITLQSFWEFSKGSMEDASTDEEMPDDIDDARKDGDDEDGDNI
ncbi:hypothetical protein QM012_002384 [Aureobasidium pullulans]|uniref:MYND-type domain-containing protein n=1 Tax=Aureobasidium pullulans TaxID=5580 RepID=A0ABR0TBS0_AURPU